MQVRFIEMDKDYSDICSWWEQHQWPIIPKEALSTTGFIVENENQKILSGWVYHTNSNTALLEFIVANPKIKGEDRDKAFDVFFDVVFKYVELSNFKNIFMSVIHPKLKTRLEKVGFKKTDDNVTNFVRGA